MDIDCSISFMGVCCPETEVAPVPKTPPPPLPTTRPPTIKPPSLPKTIVQVPPKVATTTKISVTKKGTKLFIILPR